MQRFTFAQVASAALAAALVLATWLPTVAGPSTPPAKLLVQHV